MSSNTKSEMILALMEALDRIDESEAVLLVQIIPAGMKIAFSGSAGPHAQEVIVHASRAIAASMGYGSLTDVEFGDKFNESH